MSPHDRRDSIRHGDPRRAWTGCDQGRWQDYLRPGRIGPRRIDAARRVAWVTFSRRETLRALYVAGRKQEVSQKGASASPFLNEPSHSKDRVFAKRLIAYETRGNRSFETNTPVAFLVGEKLRPHLARLMGKVGFRELLSRALVLAKAEVPWLNAVRIKADGSFEELDALAAQVDPD